MKRREFITLLGGAEESHEWDDHAWFGLGATSRH